MINIHEYIWLYRLETKTYKNGQYIIIDIIHIDIIPIGNYNFGEEFGIGWFLPLKAGGFYELIKNKTLVNTENLDNEGNDKNKIKNE